MTQPNEQKKRTIEPNPNDPIARILSSEDPILPSSGFLASVMERVLDESRVPAPLPFPWKRAIPGILLAAGTFGWGAYEFMREGIPAMHTVMLLQSHMSAAATQSLHQIAWVGLAFSVSLFTWKLSRRLSGQS